MNNMPPILLLVEGADEKYILTNASSHWFADKAELFNMEDAKGGSSLKSRFKTILNRSHAHIKVIGIVTDAEESAASTKQAWDNLLSEFQKKSKIHCAYFVNPHQEESGALERVVLNALQADSLAKCAVEFRDCVKSTNKVTRNTAQWDKLAVQSWLNATLGGAYGNISFAQDKNPDVNLFNYDHEAFMPIKTFLEDLLSHVQ